jgi:hypothetical protein
MKSTPDRSLTLFDTMVLVAATAAGFALCRVCIDYFRWVSEESRVGWWANQTRLASNLVLMWTLAYFPLRLRQPRPPWRRVARQPGMVACCAIVLAVALSALRVLSTAMEPGRATALSGNNLFVMVVSHIVIAHSVAAAWMALVLATGWRPERSWIDRMGRALGTFWLVALAILSCLPYLG